MTGNVIGRAAPGRNLPESIKKRSRVKFSTGCMLQSGRPGFSNVQRGVWPLAYRSGFSTPADSRRRWNWAYQRQGHGPTLHPAGIAELLAYVLRSAWRGMPLDSQIPFLKFSGPKKVSFSYSPATELQVSGGGIPMHTPGTASEKGHIPNWRYGKKFQWRTSSQPTRSVFPPVLQK